MKLMPSEKIVLIYLMQEEHGAVIVQQAFWQSRTTFGKDNQNVLGI